MIRRLLARARGGAGASAADAGTMAPISGVVDPTVAVDLAERGYSRLGVILDPESVAAARRVFADAMSEVEQPVGDRWFPSVLLTDEAARDTMSSGLAALCSEALETRFDPAQLELMRLDYSVKPPSPHSELGPHQDFSIVDERRATSLYVWIALEDMTAENGTLHVVPGSHRFANKIRSQHVPATFDAVGTAVHRSAECLDVRAGEAVAMVSGVIHYSPPNQGTEVRLAAHGILKPVGEPLVFYYADDETPAGQVECYETDLDTYVELVRTGRPDEHLQMTEMVARPLEMTEERFAAGLAALGTGARG